MQIDTKTKFWSRNSSTGAYDLVDIQTGEVIQTQSLPTQVQPAYNEFVVDLIAQRLAEGESLTEICKKPGFPSYALLCKWRRFKPEINSILDQARRDRAETMRDLALKEALDADEDTVAEKRLKHDAYKWAAGLDDAKYSPKAKIEATVNAPTMIVLNTGIDRNIINVNTTNIQNPGEQNEQIRSQIESPNTATESAAGTFVVDADTTTVEVHNHSSTPIESGDDLDF